MTAHRAFQFCKQYKRTTEFRRLCEIIRNHLANLNKYRDQRDRPDLSTPESMQLYLDTRFEQLKVATELELWQVCCFYFFTILCIYTGFLYVNKQVSTDCLFAMVKTAYLFLLTFLVIFCRKHFDQLKISMD